MADLYLCTRCRRDDLPGDAFSPSQLRRPSGRWCKACHNKLRREKRAGVRPKRITEACLHCGADIRHMRAHARWCSTSCSARAFRAANPGCSRRYHIRCAYGLEVEDYDALVVAQGGRCAICLVPGPAWHVDHDHATGKVRGLLCRECNTGLGFFRDNGSVMQRAIEYLDRNSGWVGQAR